MIEIFFVVCTLVGTSDEFCEDRSLTYVENLTPYQCVMRAQTQLALWSNENPEWVITSFGCRRPRGGKDA